MSDIKFFRLFCSTAIELQGNAVDLGMPSVISDVSQLLATAQDPHPRSLISLKLKAIQDA